VAATNGSSFGTNAQVRATAFNSVAIGTGSVATDPNTVSVGQPGATRRITNVSPAIYGTDAPNWDQVKSLWRQANRGIAMSMAMGSMLTPSAPGKTTINLGAGFYAGESASALNVVHRVNIATPVFVSAGISAAE